MVGAGFAKETEPEVRTPLTPLGAEYPDGFLRRFGSRKPATSLMAAVGFAALALGTWEFAHEGAKGWISLLRALGFGLFFFYFAWRLRIVERARRTVTLYTVLREGLEVEVRFDGRPVNRPAILKWQDVRDVVEEEHAVVLHLRSGGTEELRNERFPSDDARRLLLSLARSRGDYRPPLPG